MVKCNLLLTSLTSLVIMLDLRNIFHIILGQCEIFMTWAKFYHHICILYNCPSLLWLETNVPVNRCNLIHFSGILTAHAGVAAMPQSAAALSAPSDASKTAKVSSPYIRATYGSVSAGREKSLFRVTFFFTESLRVAKPYKIKLIFQLILVDWVLRIVKTS